MMGRGAASVKLITLLDKQKARRVALQPDYFGFVLDESFVVGYGMGAPDVGRNLPYIAAVSGPARPGA
jgi:hypoxanthine phosphoribosyltransferase